MKRAFPTLIILSIIFFISFTSAKPCTLDVSMVNQDPYPAIPGDYVDVVFQMTGVDNPECGEIAFEVVQKFPFSLDGEEAKKTIQGNTYIRDFTGHWMIPYTLTIDENALDGTAQLETKYYSETLGSLVTKNFDIEIEDARADFEIYIKDYSFATNELTLEILNIADVDAQAITIEIPKQDNIGVSGSNRVIVGDVDSNEYTSADFTADVKTGDIKLDIHYTDQIGVRRTIEKTVYFDADYFSSTIGADQGTSAIYYVIAIIAIALIIWWVFRRKKRKKERAAMHRRGMAKL